MITIKKGLDIPINGKPSTEVDLFKQTRNVAVIGPDFIGMKPTLFVKEGEHVITGQALFECKKNPGVIFTSPASGKVKAITRGPKRSFQTLEIDVRGNQHKDFKSFLKKDMSHYSENEIRSLLIESGMWTTIRKRPYDKTPCIEDDPYAIFVSLIDSNPLAVSPGIVIKEKYDWFLYGMRVISQLTKGTVHLCHDKYSYNLPEIKNLKKTEFQGVHPAGNVGTHINFLQPIHPKISIWHIGYQDIIAIGHLFKTGRLHTERWIALGGPRARNPRILKTHIGAHLDELLVNEIKEPKSTRIISGSILNGRIKKAPFEFLGSFHNQISCLEEDKKRHFLGWHSPGFNRFSQKRIYLSKLRRKYLFDLGTSNHGSLRAMVPTGSFEEVNPLDILPTQLLRALVTEDTDLAQDLGCLDLAEEDLALYTFVSPGKVDFAPILRRNLNKIEKEG